MMIWTAEFVNAVIDLPKPCERQTEAENRL